MFISFFFNDTATTEIYTLSLHDALPILYNSTNTARFQANAGNNLRFIVREPPTLLSLPDRIHTRILDELFNDNRSEEHTSELQSRLHLVCRLLLEKKKKDKKQNQPAKRR